MIEPALLTSASTPASAEEVLHLPQPRPDQWDVLNHPARYKVVCCGRQWGKNVTGGLAALLGHGRGRRRGALQGGHIFWIGKDYTSAQNIWQWLKAHTVMLATEKSEEDHRLVYPGGGSITVRSAERPDSCRGFTLDGVVWDEAAFASGKNDERSGGYYLFNDVLRKALTVRRGWVMFISTPAPELNWFHEWFERAEWAEEQPQSTDWVKWQRPSSDNPLIAPDEIEEMRLEDGPITFAREVLAQFVTYDAGLFKREWWQEFEEAPVMLRVENHVDSAFLEGVQHDESAIATWGVGVDRHFYVLDLWHGRVDFPKLQVAAHRQATKWQSAYPNLVTVIEPKASGLSLYQSLRTGFRTFDGTRYPPVPAVEMKWPKGLLAKKKEQRAESVTGLVEGGLVHLPRGAPWRKEFIEQHTLFPGGRHDDIVDTTSQALTRLGGLLRQGGARRRGLRIVRAA